MKYADKLKSFVGKECKYGGGNPVWIRFNSTETSDDKATIKEIGDDFIIISTKRADGKNYEDIIPLSHIHVTIYEKV